MTPGVLSHLCKGPVFKVRMATRDPGGTCSARTDGQGRGELGDACVPWGGCGNSAGAPKTDAAGDRPPRLRTPPGDGGVCVPAPWQLWAGMLGFRVSLIIGTMFQREVRGKKERATGQVLPGWGRRGSRTGPVDFPLWCTLSSHGWLCSSSPASRSGTQGCPPRGQRRQLTLAPRGDWSTRRTPGAWGIAG